MIPDTRPIPRTSRVAIVLLAIALLVVGYGDGLAAGLQERFNLPSPWIILFAALLVLIAIYAATANRGIAAGKAFQIEVLLWAFGLGLAAQLLIHSTLNVAGYVQLALFVVALTLVRSLFARAPSRLLVNFGPSVLLAHAFLCGYVIAAFVVWHLAGVDIGIRRLIGTYGPAVVSAYYGYRPAAWGAEPAWTAMALSVSCSAGYYLMPAARRFVLLSTAVAALFLQSGTLFLFLSLVVCGLLLRRNARLGILAGILVAAALVPLSIGSDRISIVLQGQDPSLMMRYSSAQTAMDVVSRSFPIGVGYGNFRDTAVYAAAFSNFLDLNAASYYKSDLMILNYVAELGFGGILLVAYVFRLLGFGRFLLITIFLALQTVLSGTVLVPALLVLAALRGIQDHAETTELGLGVLNIGREGRESKRAQGMRRTPSRRPWVEQPDWVAAVDRNLNLPAGARRRS